MDTVNIVIPVYNEAETITRTMREIKRFVHVSYVITAIYDFEEDSTIPVISSLNQEGFDIHLMRNEFGGGVLGALKTGFKNLSGVIIVVMADNSDSLSAVDPMVDLAKKGYDIVCGSRYIRGGGHIGGPLIKRTLSRIAGVSLHYLTGIPTHDVTNNFKLYTKKVLDAISMESVGGFEIGMEIVVKAFVRGYRITEVPSVWKDRTAGNSKFRLWSLLPGYIHWYVFAVRNTLHTLFSKPGDQ